jgi:ABC-type glycerol-3-phosphate transport system substrate-binding protein
MKRGLLSLFTASFLLLGFLSSCGQAQEGKVRLTINDVFTEQPDLVSELQSEFPDIQFTGDYYRGRNPASYTLQQLSHDDASDLYLSPSLPSSDMQKSKLLDLSGYSFANKFDNVTWRDYSIDGGIYMFPGPLEVSFLAYNASLFKENGWSVPNSFSQLLSLCKTIRSSSSVTPISLSGANPNLCLSFLTSLAMTQNAFSEVSTSWLKDYLQGSGSCSSGLSSGLSLLKQLSEAKAFDGSDYNNWNGTTYDNFVNKRKSAFLLVMNGQDLLDKLISANTQDTFGCLPFLGQTSSQKMLEISASLNFGLSARLGEKGNEKKLAAALKVIEYLSSVNGMKVLTGKHNHCAFPLTEAETPDISSYFRKVFALSSSAVQVRPISANFNDIVVQIGTELQNAIFYSGSTATLISDIDYLHKNAIESQARGDYGTIAEDFTADETAQLMADVLLSTQKCDLALVCKGESKDGITDIYGSSWGKLYKGTLKPTEVNIPVPQGGYVYTVPLTGAQIKSLLELGLKVTNSSTGKSAYFDFYASGMEVRKDGGRISSLTQNGNEISMSSTYNVGYVSSGLLNSSLKEIDSTLQASETNTRRDLSLVYAGYLINNSPLSPKAY